MRGKRRRKSHPHRQLYITGSSVHIAIPKTPSNAGAKFFPFTKNGTPCTSTKVGKARLGKRLDQHNNLSCYPCAISWIISYCIIHGYISLVPCSCTCDGPNGFRYS